MFFVKDMPSGRMQSTMVEWNQRW